MSKVDHAVHSLRRTIFPLAWAHRRPFWVGTGAAVVVVALRLALPWPLKHALKPWLSTAGEEARRVAAAHAIDTVLPIAFAMIALLAALGLADYLERLYYARFAIGVTRDLRAAAFDAAMRGFARARTRRPGDLVVRLLGDVARLKTGLKGFLVHVATNGVMFVCVSAVLVWVDPALGLVFAIAVTAVAAATVLAARRIYAQALRVRDKEGRLADSIQQAWGEAASAEIPRALVKKSHGRHDAALTRAQGLTTWCAHVAFGLALAAAIWIGVAGIARGTIAPDDLLVFVMYALSMRAPLVQLARQGARTGKLLASTQRIAELVSERCSDSTREPLAPLAERIALDAVVVHGGKRHGGRAVLGPIDLSIDAGERIVIEGAAGAGKTMLLELMAGVRAPSAGRVLWDGDDTAGSSMHDAARRVAFAPASPSWPKQRLSALLGVGGDRAEDATIAHILDASGARAAIERLPEGLDAALSSDDVSIGERRALALARALLKDASVYLLDDPPGDVEACVDALDRGATVVVARSTRTNGPRGCRVVVLENGRLARAAGIACAAGGPRGNGASELARL